MTLVQELETVAIDRDAERGWTRQIIPSIEEWYDPDLLKPFSRAYLSESSLSVRDTRTRKLVGRPVSTGEVSRLYLRQTMKAGAEGNPNALIAKKVPYYRDALEFMERRPAYFFNGQAGGPFALVDISACYATIYSRLTLDMTYRPDTNPPLFGMGRAPFPRVGEWVEDKASRNALFGTVLRPFTREWRHGEPVDDAFPNSYFAPDLVGIVFDACHAIALEARERFGALSWAVDGGVFRPEEARDFGDWLWVTYGLNAEIRAEGPGWLFGATSYAIGSEVTMDVQRSRARVWPESSNLRRTGKRKRAWLADSLMEVAA